MRIVVMPLLIAFTDIATFSSLSYHGSIIVVMLNFCFFINPFCFHSLTLIVVNKISNQIQVKMGYVRIL